MLVHGVWMPGAEMGFARHRLAARGYEPHQFHFRSVGRSTEESVVALMEFQARIEAPTLHFVGHSMGGLLILKMFARFALARPGRIVALGSPLRGSWVAERLSRHVPGRLLLGRAAEPLTAGFEQLPPDREVGVVAGDWPVGIGRMWPDMPQPSDGTVSVAETRLPGLADHISLRVNHMGLLFSTEVMDQTSAFLRDGRFTRP